MARLGAFGTGPIASARTFDLAQRLDVPGGPQAIPTPGHTGGSAAYHFPELDALFTGDALVTQDAFTGEVGPRIVCRAFTEDSAAALDSLRTLAATGAGTVLLGHGDPATGGISAAVDSARRAGIS
ncbi:glyoxylase-like metal-dependent hydrolase (beta-lactamase superfamily II) [Allocatelliglobosispora scoriae]|uniref:Glyoxylase-like metal-dependent hydrolase (Beta-lactamase superfamily II) n=1 Tax=Allocatelliglobosispora scoriae TaxID=643052 RepID=A0A841BNJ4_9ACTN|nr:MBL fold metallo-hydrolase [Allocatelliglobosispora scoriae]MBB5868312.1 glyoxylase-like metal-dependent hydrolase (beta-lactamase superfamily II) [Allocatelliglobosispora scoriae]